ncbi:MAG: hypothetical protein KGS61_09725, partial [Verrucomicrobia bacterium]|nr:hypothetical protein [Verrucomicrobiota bacterium]
TTVGGVTVNYIAKWDGHNWSALGSGMGGVGPPTSPDFPSVNALAVSGTNLYAGGYFTTAGAVAANFIAKWDGNKWSALGSGIGGAHPLVLALAVSGSDVYAGGSFTTAGGMAANYIAKWDGQSWNTLGSGMNGNVYALAAWGTNLYAGGAFTTADGVAANNVAQWDGSDWRALGLGMNGGVAALAVSDNNLYAGGWFTSAGGIVANNIAMWDGSTWNGLGSGISGVSQGKGDGGILPPPLAPYVSTLAVSGGNLYVGGLFTRAGGVVANGIAKWDGNNWSALGSGMNGGVKALAISDSNLYAGGIFTTAGEVSVNSIAKWDGSNWSGLGSGMSSSSPLFPPMVLALAVSGSDLYVGGAFATAGGVPATNIAKWDGTNWGALGLGMNGSVGALAVSGGDLYAGGLFTAAGNVPASYIAKWDGTSWSALGSGVGWISSFVEALRTSGSDLYVGGVFATAGGKVSEYLARAVLGDAPGYNQLRGTLLPGGATQFCYVGDPTTNYALDRTFELTPPISWVGLQTNSMTVSGVLLFTNTPATGTNNFWRVRSVP